MANDPDEKAADEAGAGGSDAARAPDSAEGEAERPTVAPPFDPAEFAKEMDSRPGQGTVGVAEGLKKLASQPRIDAQPDAADASRDAAKDASKDAPPRNKTPSSIMQIANSQIPSRLPPRGTEESELTSPEIPRLKLGSLDSVELPKPNIEASSSDGGGGERAEKITANRSPATLSDPPPAMPRRHPSVDGLSDSLDAPLSRPGPMPDLLGKSEPSLGSEPPPTRDAKELAAEQARATAAEPAASRTPSVAQSRTPSLSRKPSLAKEGPPTESDMNDRFSLGDYSGALEIAEKLLADDPDNESVKGTAESCRNVLRAMFTARIGPLDRVPLVMVPRDQLRWLSIDHRAGFVLSLIDGVSSLEMILDVSGMPQLDALRILSELAQQRIISFR